MKKRLFTLLLAVSLTALTLPACTKEAAQETSTNVETSKNTESTESMKEDEDVNDSDSTTETSEKEPIDIRLNEVAHSIFYAPMYAAIEEGYFEEEGIALDLTCGFGADKVMTAVLSGEADIGFMGSESSIYTYNEGANDYVVNFAQLTQRAGNFLVAREEMPEFTWNDLKGKTVLGGRKGVIHIFM